MSHYEENNEAYEATEMFRAMRAMSEATTLYLAGYYGYLAGTSTFPPWRDDFTPEDFNEPIDEDLELTRALRKSDWFTLGMVAARREQNGENGGNFLAYVPSEVSARATRHAWYRDIDAGDKAPSGSRILH